MVIKKWRTESDKNRRSMPRELRNWQGGCLTSPNSPATRKQKRLLSVMINSGLVERLRKDKWTYLTRQEANELIQAGNKKRNSARILYSDIVDDLIKEETKEV
jgi:hypothetical protein